MSVEKDNSNSSKSTCQEHGCQNRPLSYINWCYEHLPEGKEEDEPIERLIENDNRREVTDMYLKGVHLTDFVFHNKLLHLPEFSSMEFDGVKFEDITFEAATLFDWELSDCQFINCRFEDSNLSDWVVNFATFKGCEFGMCELTSVQFENAQFEDCNFVSNSFIAGSFNSIPQSKRVWFTDCTFNQQTFENVDISEYHFRDCAFTRTSIHDCHLSQGVWEHVNHDFDLGLLPVLCDFHHTDFLSMKNEWPGNFTVFNNIGKDLLEFYVNFLDYIQNELNEGYISTEYLFHVKSLINRVESKYESQSNNWLINKVFHLYQSYIEKIKNSHDIGMLGELLSHYNELPLKYQSTGLALPPVGGDQIQDDAPEASLQLRFALSKHSPRQLQQFFNTFTDCTLLLPNAGNNLEISELRLGSVIATLTGAVKELVILGLTLGATRKEKQLKIKIDAQNLQKLTRENAPERVQRAEDKARLESKILLEDLKQKVLETEKKERHLERQEALAEIALQKEQLNLEQQKLELWQAKVEAFKQLDALCGHPYRNHMNTQRGMQMKSKAEQLIQEFPIEEAILTINRLQIQQEQGG